VTLPQQFLIKLSEHGIQRRIFMVATEPSPLPELPTQVSRVLTDFVAAAQAALATDLRSVVLFGSAAEGRLRATSDVNLLLLLTKFDQARANELRTPLSVAQAAIRLSPMFILETELPFAITAFAEKFSDILRRRKVLHGPDPFVGVKIPRETLIIRLDQVLLNLILRLREAYMMRGLREEQLALAIADAAGPLRSCAATLLELEGRTLSSPKAALEKFVQTSGNSTWTEVLQHISEAREQRILPAGVAGPSLLKLIEIAHHLRSNLNQLT
jgi:predicted nucleotidyltransferase